MNLETKNLPDGEGYSLDQSPFFRLKSRKKLASLYNVDLHDLESIIDRADNYRIFEIRQRSNKPRIIEWPKPHLENFHARTLGLLQRIRQPDYLHSGVSGRSYISNASVHKGHVPVAKLDIRKFYPSTNGGHVFGGIKLQFDTSPDVAGTLTKLCTYDNHLPTGSCVSQALAFIAHKKMFDEIAELCAGRGLKMTCYVDDITISGLGTNRGTISAVGKIIERRGLSHHGLHLFGPDEPKIITGVVVRGNEVLVPNKRQQKIFERLMEVRQSTPNADLYHALEQLQGMANAAAELEGRYGEVSAEVRGQMLAVRKFLRN